MQFENGWLARDVCADWSEQHSTVAVDGLVTASVYILVYRACSQKRRDKDRGYEALVTLADSAVWWWSMESVTTEPTVVMKGSASAGRGYRDVRRSLAQEGGAPKGVSSLSHFARQHVEPWRGLGRGRRDQARGRGGG